MGNGKSGAQDRSRQGHGPIRNWLLTSLSAEDLGRITPHLTDVTLPRNQRLMEPGKPTEYVYFPETSMVSLILSLEGGAIVEVGLIGREGLVGVLAGLGSSAISGEAIVQMPGLALRMPTDILRREMGISSSIRQMLLRYVQALFAQVSQSAACNGQHSLAERLARWLLMAHDCAEADELILSHEYMSMMIGVRRAGVTIALGVLKRAGIITNRHGRIVILDRRKLEASACECYLAVRQEYNRLLR
jgi:CRP-like cAMP-binding protein